MGRVSITSPLESSMRGISTRGNSMEMAYLSTQMVVSIRPSGRGVRCKQALTISMTVSSTSQLNGNTALELIGGFIRKSNKPSNQQESLK